MNPTSGLETTESGGQAQFTHGFDGSGGTASPTKGELAQQIANFFDFHISGDP